MCKCVVFSYVYFTLDDLYRVKEVFIINYNDWKAAGAHVTHVTRRVTNVTHVTVPYLVGLCLPISNEKRESNEGESE